MNNIKSCFSIKDLENLTGIKAHTIRIWEKRYNLLEPERTDTNIRYYSLANLQKLLNISYLNSNGYKISRIASFSHEEISQAVKKISSKKNGQNQAINTLKLAMLNFNQNLFYSTYEDLIEEKSFETIFYEVFIPLMHEIGMLWQTDTITPAHEHFITTLIRQKIILNTELLQMNASYSKENVFVLYLPENEIHELGLMFINYGILKKGYQSIFLGPSVPIESLTDIVNYYDDIIFISYFTIKPERDALLPYLSDFEEKILKNSNNQLWVLGQMLQYIDLKEGSESIQFFKTIDSLMEKI